MQKGAPFFSSVVNENLASIVVIPAMKSSWLICFLCCYMCQVGLFFFSAMISGGLNINFVNPALVWLSLLFCYHVGLASVYTLRSVPSCVAVVVSRGDYRVRACFRVPGPRCLSARATANEVHCFFSCRVDLA